MHLNTHNSHKQTPRDKYQSSVRSLQSKADSGQVRAPDVPDNVQHTRPGFLGRTESPRLEFETTTRDVRTGVLVSRENQPMQRAEERAWEFVSETQDVVAVERTVGIGLVDHRVRCEVKRCFRLGTVARKREWQLCWW